MVLNESSTAKQTTEPTGGSYHSFQSIEMFDQAQFEMSGLRFLGGPVITNRPFSPFDPGRDHLGSCVNVFESDHQMFHESVLHLQLVSCVRIRPDHNHPGLAD